MDLRGAAVAVTGATGFLGRYIVDAGLATRIELRRADLGDPAALARGFAGAAAVVANAALFSLGNLRWADHERANIEGTRNVLAAMADAGVRRLVHVSSVAVYRGRGRAITEDHPQLGPDARRTFTNAYAISKALSEQLAWEQARALGIAMTAVRPCAIYGAFDPNFMRVIRRLMSLPVSVTPVLLRLPLVHAGDVAEAMARAAVRGVPRRVARGGRSGAAGRDSDPRAVCDRLRHLPRRGRPRVAQPLLRRGLAGSVRARGRGVTELTRASPRARSRGSYGRGSQGVRPAVAPSRR